MINEQIEIVQEDKKNELLMMKTYIEKVEKGKKKKTYIPLFSEKQKENIKSIEKIVDKEMERQEKERKRQEEEIRKKKKRKEENGRDGFAMLMVVFILMDLVDVQTLLKEVTG